MPRFSVQILLVAALTVGVSALRPRSEPAFAGAGSKAGPADARWMGVASCASAACHHDNGPRGSKRSEYTTWAGHDTHARAFQDLAGERANTIMRNVYPDEKRDAQKEPTCLACHAAAAGAPNAKGPRFQLADGVGCENCHGPAEHYLTEHYRDGFAGQSEDEKCEKYGLLRTKNLAERARLCAGCHVGDAATGREVNHDLYASGHPPLHFEYAAYLAQFPRHWDVARDKERHADYEARVWAIGQVVSARASLELLRDRAARATTGKAPWPEFAEYACTSCHKDLTQSSLRGVAAPGVGVPGSLPWGAWTWSTARRLAEGREAKVDLKEWDRFRQEMERPRPQAAEVCAAADSLLQSIDTWEQRSAHSPAMTPTSLRALQARLLPDCGPTEDVLLWEEVMQLYLALEALRHARQELEKSPTTPAYRSALHDLRSELTGPFNPIRSKELLRRIRANSGAQ